MRTKADGRRWLNVQCPKCNGPLFHDPHVTSVPTQPLPVVKNRAGAEPQGSRLKVHFDEIRPGDKIPFQSSRIERPRLLTVLAVSRKARSVNLTLSGGCLMRVEKAQQRVIYRGDLQPHNGDPVPNYGDEGL